MPNTPVRPTTGDSTWFTHDRFGLFIHWGLYSLAARHEWFRARERLTNEQYEIYFKAFEPDLYDPDLWAKAAADAGMKYFVVTTKHHEGFCLWDSKLTDYKSTVAPHCRRDLLRPMVDAFRGRGMRVGLYHSLIDWHHKDFFVDDRHPQRAEVGYGPSRDAALIGVERTADPTKLPAVNPNTGRDQMKYADYLHGQVRELLSEFGPIDVMWFDFSYPDASAPADFQKGKGRAAWRSEELLRLIRQLQPQILLNDRMDLTGDPTAWDFVTPEQSAPPAWPTKGGQRVVWEACQTFSGSWGYHRDEQTWRDTDELIRTLIDSVSKGGNLLLNVGPTGRGEFDARALDRLAGIGRWMKHHARSIYGCGEAPPEFECPRDCRLTYNPDRRRLYVHLMAYPYKHVHLGRAFAERVEYAQFLHDASELSYGTRSAAATEFAGGGGDDPKPPMTINVPKTKPDATVPVIELFLK